MSGNAPRFTRLQSAKKPIDAIQVASRPGKAGADGQVGRSGRGGGKSQARARFMSLLKLLVPHWRHPVARRLLLMASVVMIRTAVNDRVARLQGLLFKVVFLRQRAEFIAMLTENVILCLVVSVLNSTLTYLTRELGIQLRILLTEKVSAKYFRSMAFYRLAFVDGRVAYPDQVIVGDIPKFAETLSEAAQESITGLVEGIYFTAKLYNETGWKWAAASWAWLVFAIAATQAVSPPFGRLLSTQQGLDGEYREAHNHLSTNAESVAALGGYAVERSLIENRLRSALTHAQKLLGIHWRFGMFEDFMVKYITSTVAMCLILGPFFSPSRRPDGSMERSGEALSRMRYVTSCIINQMVSIGGMAYCARKVGRCVGYSDRIAELLQVLGEVGDEKRQQQASHVQEGNAIAFEQVNVVTPTGHTLVENLSFRITPGTNLLITGANGAGKSSLFRCLGGLWDVETGAITKPKNGENAQVEGLCGDVFYIPQKPYNVIGTLRDQITYPAFQTDRAHPILNDSQLHELLTMVDLGHLLKRSADTVVQWEEMLSIGETQRLAMARLFYHSPTFAILDECTSGVSNEMEERLYHLCAERKITCITISHRPALLAYHDMRLYLDGEKGYTLTPINRSEKNQQLLGRHTSSAIVDAMGTKADVRVTRQLVRRSRELPSPVASPTTTTTGSNQGSPTSSTAGPKSWATSSVARPPSTQHRSLVKQLRSVLSILVPRVKDRTTGMTLMLALVVAARVALSDRIAHLNGDTTAAVIERDLPRFLRLVGVSVAQCLAAGIMAPTLQFLTKSLALQWRKRLTHFLHQLYFTNKAFYRLTHLGNEFEIRDPETRLTEDVESLCTEIASTCPELIKPVVDIFWFTYQCNRYIGLRNTSLLYTYMAGGFFALKFLTPDFTSMIQQATDTDASFRFLHTRLRTYAESVAFFGGDQREEADIRAQFAKVIATAKSSLRTRWVYGIFDDFITRQLPYLVTWGLSWLYNDIYSRHGMLATNVADGSAGVLIHDLRYVASSVSHNFLAFGEVIRLNQRFHELSGYASRVTELSRALQTSVNGGNAGAVGSQTQESNRITETSDSIALSDVDVIAPDGALLAVELTLAVGPKQHLLVTGPSGSGKTSLFRVIGGLWPIYGQRGHVCRPASAVGQAGGIFLVPQRPYMAIGTLLDQITYPVCLTNANDEAELQRCAQILKMVGLPYLVERHEGGWQSFCRWQEVLSLGEQQRLGMARLLYHHPAFAVLDQCTDAISVDIEAQLYQHAHEAGITIITISQRPALTHLHTQELRMIDGRGQWELAELTTSTGPASPLSPAVMEDSLGEEKAPQALTDATTKPEDKVVGAEGEDKKEKGKKKK